MKKNSFFSSPLFVLVAVSLILTVILFRGGSTLGGGEVGVPFYNLSRLLDMTQMALTDRGLGNSTGLGVGGAPYFKFFSVLQNFGVPGFLLQAGFFFICIFVTLISSYMLVREIFPEIDKKSGYYSSIFYLVNPFALVCVWNRFLPNQIMFYSFLPLGVWLFILGLKTHKHHISILNMILTAVFSVAFIGPSQTIVFWGLLFLISIYYYFYIKRERYVFFYFLYNIFLWLVFNFFWISQQLHFRFSQSYSVLTNSFFTAVGNFETFNSLSKTLGKLSNLFLMQHGPFYNEWFGFPFNWPSFYSHPVSIVVQWIFLIYVLVITIKKINIPWVRFFFFIFIIGVFASKGNTPPLGEVLDFLFRKISILEFFRNPFEKAGIFLAFGLTPLIGLAIYELDNWVWKLKLVPWLYLIIFLGFPFWTGLVFTGSYSPANNPEIGYQVSIPNYYSHADNYLSKQNGIFRFITFPLGGEGIFNTWSKGYTGVEQSGVLFSTPSISYNTTIPFYNNIASDLEELFIRYPDFYRLAGILNVKYLMFRPDFDYLRSGMRDPKFIEEILTQKSSNPSAKLSFVSDFAPLKLFKFDDDIVLPKIYAANKNINSDVVGSLEDFLLVQGNPGDIISNQNNTYLDDRTMADISHSRAIFSLSDKFPKYSEDYYVFPYVSVAPWSYKYRFVRLKEQFQLLTKFSNLDKVSFKVLLLGKRLKEVRLALDTNDLKNAEIVLNSYSADLPSVISQIKSLESFKQLDERTWKQEEMFTTFSSHLFMLNEFEKSGLNKDGIVTKTKLLLRNQTAEAKILPKYDPIVTGDFPVNNRMIYQWKTEKEGSYEIVFPGTSLFPEEFHFPTSGSVQLDGHVEKVDFRNVDSTHLSLGNHKLTQGLHELQIIPPISSNLLGNNLSFILEALDKPVQKRFSIQKFDPYSQYNINFDYKIFYGSGLNLSINSNVDQPDSITGQLKPVYSKGLLPDGYWYDYKNFSSVFNPPQKSNYADVVFSADLWNNCRDTYINLPKECLKVEVIQKFSRPTKVEVTNVSLSPRLPIKLFLIAKHEVETKIDNPEVGFKMVDLTHYKVDIKGAKKPFLLVFSELYNAGWQINLDNKNVEDKNHFLVNGYANSWWIDKTGDFKLDIIYKPQKFLNLAYIISAITIFACTVFMLILFMFKINKNHKR